MDIDVQDVIKVLQQEFPKELRIAMQQAYISKLEAQLPPVKPEPPVDGGVI